MSNGRSVTLRRDKVITGIEHAIVSALQLLVILLTTVATITLFVLFGRNVLAEVSQTATIADMLPAMQRSFAGVLIVVLGLELLETLRAYFVDHHVKAEIILVVAVIAIGRDVLQVDFEHTPGLELIGLAAVIIALCLGYFLVKKSHRARDAEGVEDQAGMGKELQSR
jgi:uncharacterized membrane protein (DUF373 family)